MWVMEMPGLGEVNEELTAALTYADGTPVYALTPAERAAVLTVYQLYDALLGQPHQELTPIVLDAIRPHMHLAYGQVQIGGRLANLRSSLLASAENCPYCGFGEPRDLDHYLPRSDYGELAIFSHNLVPSCSPCNNAKRTVVPGLAPAQGPGLIHPYFQALPDVDFLTAEASFHGGGLEVRFNIDPIDLAPDLSAKLQFQIDRLKLNERYPRQINKFLSEQRTSMLMLKDIGPQLFRDYLTRSAESLASNSSYGRNDWRVALLRALSGADSFCDNPEQYLGP